MAMGCLRILAMHEDQKWLLFYVFFDISANRPHFATVGWKWVPKDQLSVALASCIASILNWDRACPRHLNIKPTSLYFCWLTAENPVHHFSIPMLAASSKLDKKALPLVDKSHTESDPEGQPSTETEKKLVPLWMEVLSLKSIDVQESFFDLGGWDHKKVCPMILSEMPSISDFYYLRVTSDKSQY